MSGRASSEDPANPSNRDNIKRDFEKISAKGFPSVNDLDRLYRAYPDNEAIIDEILRLYEKRNKKVRAEAKKAAEKVYNRYFEGMTLHQIMQKMTQYKKKKGWSDFEFDQFRKHLTDLWIGSNTARSNEWEHARTRRTRITRALGQQAEVIPPGLNIKPFEEPFLAEILRMHAENLALTRSCFMSTITYQDCGLMAMTATFKRGKDNPYNHINPVVAALFLPKFELLEHHMLLSDIGEIVKCRNDKTAITSQANNLLYDDMINDPMDVVCDSNSAFADLRNRYRVQNALKKTVMNLRNGQIYEGESNTELLNALTACRNDFHYDADLVFASDAGQFVRKLFSCFSLRPIIISVRPAFALLPGLANMMGQSMSPMSNGISVSMCGGNLYYNNQPAMTMTTVPMLSIDVPFTYKTSESVYSLTDAMTQNVWLTENKMMVPKEKSISYVKEVLVFYVKRTIDRVNVKSYARPFTFSQIPLTMFDTYNKMNPYPIDSPETITLSGSGDTFKLRSVVAIEVTKIAQGSESTTLITGNYALIHKPSNFSAGSYQSTYYIYNPYAASVPVKHPHFNPGELGDEYENWILNKPISIVSPYEDDAFGKVGRPFYDRARTNGTVYVYGKTNGYDPYEVIRPEY